MLLEVQKHLTTHKVGHFYGQELNATTYNLSRMNMIMHGVDWQNFDIYKGDTLKDDKYGYDLRLTVQVCNPPYSLKWSADKKFEDDPRYRGVGKLAPKSAADLAFVEHMIYHMDETDGRVAVLLPHGVLFRGGAEEAIRIHDPEEWKLWSDSSGKSDPPPDFYNDKLKLMMDVMRIDDHAFESKNGKIVNPTNQRESVIQKQIRKSGLLDSFPNVKNVIVTAVTDLPTDEDHNYKFYYSNFERVLMKHNNQIDLYGKNHPGYKTIFLVLDESSAYFEMESIMDNGVIKGKPHYWFWDNSFVNILKKLNIDYLIWYAPFKYYEVPLGEEKSDLPEVCVIDIKNINQNGSYLNSYDISKMKSVEL